MVRSFLEGSKSKEGEPNACVNFLVGAGSKAVASVTTYPLVVSKVHLYTQHPGEESNEHGLLEAVQEILSEEGVRGLYKGLSSQIGSAMLKEAFLNMTRHEIYFLVHSSLTSSNSKVAMK